MMRREHGIAALDPSYGYLDDSQIAKLTIERGYDRMRPRIEIAVDTTNTAAAATYPTASSG